MGFKVCLVLILVRALVSYPHMHHSERQGMTTVHAPTKSDATLLFELIKAYGCLVELQHPSLFLRPQNINSPIFGFEVAFIFVALVLRGGVNNHFCFFSFGGFYFAGELFVFSQKSFFHHAAA